LNQIQENTLHIYEQLKKTVIENFFGTDYDLDVEELKLYYLNEVRFQKCPHVKLHFGSHPIIAAVDSGSEVSILAQELFNNLATRCCTSLSRVPF